MNATALMWNLLSMLRLVLQRLRFNLGLSASALVGIIAVLTVAVSVPIYSYGVSSEVLHQQLQQNKSGTNRQLFSLRLTFQEKFGAPQMTLEKARTITNYLESEIPRELGLPISQIVTDVRTSGLTVTDLTGRWPEAKGSPLGRWSFVVQPILPQHAHLVEGLWPAPQLTAEGPIQVLLPAAMADEMLLQVGDRFLLDTIEVEVTGFWEVNDSNDPVWFTNPASDYSRSAWIPEETYQALIKPAVDPPVSEAYWYVIIPDSAIQFQRAPQYLLGLTRLDANLKKMVEGLQVTYTPIKALEAYEKRATELATLFYVVGAPMLVLALIFIGLTARIAVQQYENETATLRARGASPLEIIFLNLAESMMLVLIALIPALIAGWLAANLMGNTISFLQFTDRSIFTFSILGLNSTMLALVIGVMVLARLFPAISASKVTVVKVKQEQSRSSSKPFWEKFYLDFLLLIPGGYAYFVFKGWSGTVPAQLLTQLTPYQQFRDPLLFVAPAVFAIAASMLMVRIIPLIVHLLAAIAGRLPWVWAYLSLQQIARRSQNHSSALLLIIASLSLSIFIISAAKTLDRWLYDSDYYKVGSDLALQEFLLVGGGTEGESASTTAGEPIEGFLTIEEHLTLPGVAGATRAGKYEGKFSYGRGDVTSQIIGIDRLEFPQAAYYRDDFAPVSLGEMMNALGLNLNGVLIPDTLRVNNGIQVGDQLAVSIIAGNVTYDRELQVVGTYFYFPTVYPQNKPTLIMNLESIFNYPEDVEGYQMLLRLKDDADIPKLVKMIGERISPTQSYVKINGDARSAVEAGQDKPERMGLFGILNVGFFTTALMPGIGFLLYSYASLRRRFIELGILQAIGLSTRQLVASLVTEQSVLMGMATLAGAGIGLATSLLFAPFLQIGATPGAPVPPFLVLIGWAETGWLTLSFGVVLLVTMAGTILYLNRLKVFQAVKLGETL